MKALIIPFAATVLSGSSFAAVIAPDTASASSTISSGGRILDETINGSGLNTTTNPVGTWTHNSNGGNSGQYWLSNAGGSLATLDYTFNTPQNLSTLYLWSYSRTGEGDRGIQTATLSFSSDGTIFDRNESISVAQGASSNTDNPAQTFTFGDTKTNVVAVRLKIDSNYGDSNYSGLSEVRFESVAATAPIPEPSTMVIVALSGLGFFIRRR